jgi:Putative phage integrase
VSPITGHRVRVNLSYDKIYVPVDANFGVAQQLGAELPTYWEQQAAANGGKWPGAREMRDATHAFAEVGTVRDLMSAIDRMLGLVDGATAPRAHAFRALTWLTRLWAHGLIAIPPKWTAEYKINCRVSDFAVGNHLSWFEEIVAVASLKSDRERRRTNGLALRIATTAVGIRELGDLTPTTTAEAVREAMGTRATGIIRAILNAQRVRYGAEASLRPQDWGLKIYRVRKKSDVKFLWATAQDPTLDHWRRYLARWLAERPVKSQALKLGEFFLNYLLANPSVTRNPEEFCRRTYTPAVPYRDWLEARHQNQRALFDTNNLGAEFMEWLLDAHLSTPDDLGRPVRSPDHWNPVTRACCCSQPLPSRALRSPSHFPHRHRTLSRTDTRQPMRQPRRAMTLISSVL